jgi:acylphosphatase
MAKKRAYVIVSGIVQGVGYRYFAQRRGASLGLSGYVRNLPDGTVEALIEGDEESLYQMLAQLRRGPSGGRVDGVSVEWLEYEGDMHSFSVRF